MTTHIGLPEEPELTAQSADFIGDEPAAETPTPEEDKPTVIVGDDDLPQSEGVDIEKSIADSDNPETSGLVTFLGVPVDTLRTLVTERVTQEGRVKFANAVSTPGSYDNLLYFAISQNAGEVQREVASLNKISDPKFASRFDDENGKPLVGVSNVTPYPATPGIPENVTGAAGIIRMLAVRPGNVRRIPLYGSGFSIDIRVPTLDEISMLLRSCRVDKAEYESQLGAPFYMFFDRLIKKNFIEFLENLVVHSSCANWSREGVLTSNIALADYNAALTHVAALMYPKGFPNFRHFCTRPRDAEYPNGCSHVTSVKAELSRLVHTKFSCMSAESITHMARSIKKDAKFTPEELQAYRKSLGFDGRVVNFMEYRLLLKSPSFADHLEAAAVFNGALLNEVQSNDNPGILTAIKPRELRMYSQYVSTIEALDEHGNVVMTSSDQVVIAFILDFLSSRDNVNEKLLAPIKQFIDDIQLSHVCYPTFECPSCGYKPTEPSGFFTVDAQNTFFTISLLKLASDS